MNHAIQWRAVALMAATLGSAAPLVAQEPAPDSAAPTPRPKSVDTAVRLSLLGTIAPVVVGLALASAGPTNDAAVAPLLFIAGGVAVGPSLGHFYAGRSGRALTTAIVRSAVIAGSLGIALSSCPLEDCTSAEETTSAVSLIIGAGVVTVLAIYDIATAPASVRAHNQRISLAPWIPPHGRGAGVVVSVRW